MTPERSEQPQPALRFEPARRNRGSHAIHGHAGMPRPADDDETIKLATRPPSAGPRVPIRTIALAALVATLAGAGLWALWPTSSPPMAAHRTAQIPVIPPPAQYRPESEPRDPDFKIESATEQNILNHVPTEAANHLAVFRFTANPRILVLDFTSLHDQGMMLNRTAALVEKTGLPRDRLLTDPELDAAVRASGDTVETYYYGHDYSAASLVRFFALADRDTIRLGEGEAALRRLIRREGWFDPEARAALISIPQAGADEHVTPSARAAILHHELSHGEYFTNPAYAAFVHRFWAQTIGPSEREQIRSYLHTAGYDGGLDDVMENEAQAYLMFTNSPEFFTPEMFGMSAARVAELRAGFFRSMPSGWLRDSLGHDLRAGTTPAAAPPRPDAP
jgi:hypothetical protein